MDAQHGSIWGKSTCASSCLQLVRRKPAAQANETLAWQLSQLFGNMRCGGTWRRSPPIVCKLLGARAQPPRARARRARVRERVRERARHAAPRRRRPRPLHAPQLADTCARKPRHPRAARRPSAALRAQATRGPSPCFGPQHLASAGPSAAAARQSTAAALDPPPPATRTAGALALLEDADVDAARDADEVGAPIFEISCISCFLCGEFLDDLFGTPHLLSPSRPPNRWPAAPPPRRAPAGGAAAAAPPRGQRPPRASHGGARRSAPTAMLRAAAAEGRGRRPAGRASTVSPVIRARSSWRRRRSRRRRSAAMPIFQIRAPSLQRSRVRLLTRRAQPPADHLPDDLPL